MSGQIENERDPSLTALLRAAMRARLTDLHTALPAKIVSYDASKCLVDAQPLIKQRRRQPDGTVAAKDFPILRGCPVAFPRCAAGYITFPIAKDDLGLVVFCEREIGDWVQKTAGQIVDPGDGDLHPLMGAVFYPGLYPATSALSPAPSTSDLEIISSGNTILGARSGADFVSLATPTKGDLDKLTTWITGLRTALMVPAVTGVPGNADVFQAALIAYLNTPAGAIPSMDAVAASKVKAK